VIVVLAGPTGAGKSALGLALARRVGGEIVNADSQQVYRGLDVGTAKPTPAERAAVAHHLLDVAEPGEGMDAARFVSLADQAIAGIEARGRLPLVIGGTGLYLRALLHGLVEAPGRDPALRGRLAEEAAALGRPALHARLAAVDPAAAGRIHPNDLNRIVRALEIAAGGQTQSALHAAHAFRPERHHALFLALEPPRPELLSRLDARVEAMFARGLLEEARALLDRFGATLPPRLPIGYAEAVEVVRGALALDEAVRRVQAAHRQYARRQVIWLRREPGAEWIAPPIDLEGLARRVNAWRGSP
jgi:tRNA dimethylallyltransferase